MAPAREPEVVPAVLAARRRTVRQPDHAARLLAHLHLGGAAAAAPAPAAAAAAAASPVRAPAVAAARLQTHRPDTLQR